MTKRAEKDLEGLPPAMAVRVREVFAGLDVPAGVGLYGRLEGKRSTRLGHTHRIIYVVEPRGVIVLTIRPRRDAYR